jgi:hypothetical protein
MEQMTSRADSGWRNRLVRLLRENQAENSRIEFKRELQLSDVERKAEFVRDIISLANSEGEIPREAGLLIVGVKDGKFVDTSSQHLDGATFGQIIDALVFPRLAFEHIKVPISPDIRVDVIEVRPSIKHIYFVL